MWSVVRHQAQVNAADATVSLIAVATDTDCCQLGSVLDAFLSFDSRLI